METRTRSEVDSDFPIALLDRSKKGRSPCSFLRTRGPWPPPPGIAIVGTRRPDDDAAAFTRSLAAEIAATGLAVWSGGAIGIDRAAHEGAMDRGGRTVLVSPSGVDNPYPKEHGPLFERVVATGGTIVSPFRDDSPPMLGAFHRRNTVLAALTLGTVVVQAGEKSGARSTARIARRLGRPLYVVPHAPWHERGRGCALELASGAVAIVSSSTLLARLYDELVCRGERGDVDRFVQALIHEPRARRSDHDHLAGDPSDRRAPDVTERPATNDLDQRLAREHAARRPAAAPAREHACTRTLHELDAIAKRVLSAIGEVPIHMDDLCEQTRLSVASVTAALLTLTLGAVVVEAPAGYYRLSPI